MGRMIVVLSLVVAVAMSASAQVYGPPAPQMAGPQVNDTPVQVKKNAAPWYAEGMSQIDPVPAWAVSGVASVEAWKQKQAAMEAVKKKAEKEDPWYVPVLPDESMGRFESTVRGLFVMSWSIVVIFFYGFIALAIVLAIIWFIKYAIVIAPVCFLIIWICECIGLW